MADWKEVEDLHTHAIGEFERAIALFEVAEREWKRCRIALWRAISEIQEQRGEHQGG